MRLVTFQSVLHGTARMLGLNPARLDTIRSAALAEYINQHVRFGWHFDFWPEWLLTEERRYRAAWVAGTAYGAGTAAVAVEVFYIPAQTYYQSLVAANTNHAPGVLTAGEYVENSAYWAECASSYSVEDWETATDYALGDQVRFPDDGQSYQCITAHTSGASFDTSKFGILTPFNRYVAFEQTGATVISRVKLATRRDSRVFGTKPGLLWSGRSDLGVQVGPEAPQTVWLQFQTLPPVFTATAWVASTAYAVADLVYAATETYKCATAHTSAASFAVGSNWTLVKFPFLLAEYVKRCAKASSLEDLKLTNRALVNEDRASRMLEDLVDDEFEGQGQSQTANVRTYA